MAFTFSPLVNQLATTIAQEMTAVDPAPGSNLAVAATAGAPLMGYLLVDSEIVRYDLIVDGTHVRIGPSGRGSGGTTASNHANGTVAFYDAILAGYVNELRSSFDAATGHAHGGATDDAPRLLQANTHQSADTDTGPSSLHHTLGAGANQASAGNHTHPPGTFVGAKLWNNTNIPSGGGEVFLPFNTEIYKTDAGMHSNVTNNTRLIATRAGKYLIHAQLRFLNGVDVSVAIKLNGTTYISVQRLSNTTNHDLQLSGIYALALNDYVELTAQSNMTQGIDAQGYYSPIFDFVYLGQ